MKKPKAGARFKDLKAEIRNLSSEVMRLRSESYSATLTLRREYNEVRTYVGCIRLPDGRTLCIDRSFDERLTKEAMPHLVAEIGSRLGVELFKSLRVRVTL